MLGVFLCHGLSSEIRSAAKSKAGCLASKLQGPTRLCSTQGVHGSDLEAENLNAGPLASPARKLSCPLNHLPQVSIPSSVTCCWFISLLPTLLPTPFPFFLSPSSFSV